MSVSSVGSALAQVNPSFDVGVNELIFGLALATSAFFLWAIFAGIKSYLKNKVDPTEETKKYFEEYVHGTSNGDPPPTPQTVGDSSIILSIRLGRLEEKVDNNADSIKDLEVGFEDCKDQILRSLNTNTPIVDD